MRIVALSLLAIAAFVNVGCTTLPESLDIEPSSHASGTCRRLVRDIPSMNAIATLDRFSDLIASDCTPEAIRLGRWIRETYREKTYSVARESFSVLMPEDAMSEYVLESYERAYLSYVLAALEYQRGDSEAARVELRRSYREGKAFLYNYGEDAVNVVLLATLWETLDDPDTARPFWLKASTLPDNAPELKKFAMAQVERIDKHEKASWQVRRIGSMPELDWQTRFGGGHGSGYYDIHATKPLPPVCTSTTGAVVPTQSWIDKIALRHSADYHPFLNAKTWVRLPIGILYGATVVAGGVAIAAAGCSADNGNGCGEAIQLGGALASHAGDVTSFAIRPDLRHWTKVPSGFVISMLDDVASEPCHPPAPPPAKNWWKFGGGL